MSTANELQAKAAELLGAALGGLLKGDVGPWIDMFAEDGAMEFPFVPAPAPKKIEGKDALRQHLAGFSSTFEISAFSDPVYYPVAGADTVIVEFSCNGRAIKTGRDYQQNYISVLTLKDGFVANYRDYWNPLVILEALGGMDGMARFGEDA